MGTVGSMMLNCPESGYIIYFSHVVGSLINGLLYRSSSSVLSIPYAQTKGHTPFFTQLGASIISSLKTCLIIGGYVIFFAAAVKSLELSGIMTLLYSFMTGILSLNSQFSNFICSFLSSLS